MIWANINVNMCMLKKAGKKYEKKNQQDQLPFQ